MIEHVLPFAAVVCIGAVIGAGDDTVRILRVDPDRAAARHTTEARPPLPGFRPRLASDDPPIDWPFELASDAPSEVRAAAAFVARRLAADGLVPTLVRAVDRLGDRAARTAPRDREDLLRAIGIPVDLVASFAWTPAAASASASLVAHVFDRLGAGADPEELCAELANLDFRFDSHHAPFVAATESGEAEAALVRVQLTAGSYWSAPGDGGCVDLFHGLLTALPEAQFLASIHQRHLDAFLATSTAWTDVRRDRITLLVDDLAFSQWAQDNGKAGWIESPGGSRTVATLVPRYASRGEDGSTFLPGDTYAWEGLARAGHTCVRSPLLFQGGNLLVVRHPKTNERLLLLGEAELHRNVALGLSTDEVLVAFRSEFHVDRCFVLPAVGFHVDYELSVRAVGDELVAFVHDEAAGVRIVLETGVRALEDGGVLDAAAAREALALLERGEAAAFLELVGARLAEGAREYGRFARTIASGFSAGPADSDVGNLQCFLLALDLSASRTLDVGALATDRHSAAYLRSLARTRADRRALHAGLAELGFRLVPVPGLPEEERGIVYVNGVHSRTRYLMPAYGGRYDALDRAAAAAIEKVLPADVHVVSIPSAESQRRSGAVHCSAAFHPPP